VGAAARYGNLVGTARIADIHRHHHLRRGVHSEGYRQVAAQCLPQGFLRAALFLLYRALSDCEVRYLAVVRSAAPVRYPSQGQRRHQKFRKGGPGESAGGEYRDAVGTGERNQNLSKCPRFFGYPCPGLHGAARGCGSGRCGEFHRRDIRPVHRESIFPYLRMGRFDRQHSRLCEYQESFPESRQYPGYYDRRSLRAGDHACGAAARRVHQEQDIGGGRYRRVRRNGGHHLFGGCA